MDFIGDLLNKNRAWADRIKAGKPDFFETLSRQQKPEILWIGCSDSRVPATQIVDLDPGEIFVHRNISNVVVHTDLNCLSVMQFAVEVIQVKHIIVCGHYGCGGVKASMQELNNGLIDNWLNNIRDVYRLHKDEFNGLDELSSLNLLCELNVKEQVRNVCHSTIVQKAWRNGQDLKVHGWIYSIENGVIEDLQVCKWSNNQDS